MERAGELAAENLGGVAGTFSTAISRLDEAFDEEEKSLRQRIRQIDRVLLRSRI